MVVVRGRGRERVCGYEKVGKEGEGEGEGEGEEGRADV